MTTSVSTISSSKFLSRTRRSARQLINQAKSSSSPTQSLSLSSSSLKSASRSKKRVLEQVDEVVEKPSKRSNTPSHASSMTVPSPLSSTSPFFSSSPIIPAFTGESENQQKRRREIALLPHAKWQPTKKQLSCALNKSVPDIIAHNLRVLFCGINPGLMSAAVGRHFARPGNRFWPTLHNGGFTDRRLSPWEEHLLLPHYGITNVVERATANADALSRDEYIEGGRVLISKIQYYRPRVLAILGIGAYRTAFNKKSATLGLQPEKIGSYEAHSDSAERERARAEGTGSRFEGSYVWLLPSPSGLNAHFQLDDLAKLFAELKQFADKLP